VNGFGGHPLSTRLQRDNQRTPGEYWRANVSAIHGRVRVAQGVDLDAGFILMKKEIAYLASQVGLSLFPLNVRCSYTGLAAGRCIHRTCPLL